MPVGGNGCCSAFYTALNARVGATTADVAAHRGGDFRIGRRRVFGEQRDGRHDLARLAITALRNLFLNPRSLYRVDVAAIAAYALYGGYCFALCAAGGRDAGADGPAVQMDRAGATLGFAAAEFGAREPEVLPNDPEQRRARICVDLPCPAIDL